MDYVTAWYFKAAEYIQDTKIKVGFVSTNSISQGEQVAVLWNELLYKYKVKIHFAHRTFAWDSEAAGKAHVHKTERLEMGLLFWLLEYLCLLKGRD